jgi:glutamate/tyrosine decarboxylase-like PLP-dependent enzyme
VSHEALLQEVARLAGRFLEGLPERPVRASATRDELVQALGGALPDAGEADESVISRLAAGAEPGLIATAGPRFFGFVIGGSLPAALAADWLAATWDQNAGLYAASPAASVVEDIASEWLLELFGLPLTASVGFATGCQMANFTALAAARHAVLQRAGWDVEAKGLYGAPEIHVVLSAEAHVTIFSALRMLGLGSERVHRVSTDDQGRVRADVMRQVLAGCQGPTIVCAQSGNVNTGAFDPLDKVVAMAHAAGAWVHVDGAFGLWATTSPELRGQTVGIAGADSWATDAHKWLNVPYDSGIVIVADSAAHRGAMSSKAAYLIQTSGLERDPLEYVPEFSRRARGFAVYAALRSLGRRGVADMIERCSRLARRMGDRLKGGPAVRILNDVVLNQVLVRFEAPGVDADALTRAVITRVQNDGTCWLSGSKWHEMQVMRVSVSNWSTTDADIDRSADAILSALCVELSAAGR